MGMFLALLFSLTDSSSGYNQLQRFPFVHPSSAPIHCPHLDFIPPIIDKNGREWGLAIIGILSNLNLVSNLLFNLLSNPLSNLFGFSFPDV